MRRYYLYLLFLSLLSTCLPANAQSFGQTIKDRLGFNKPAPPTEARNKLLAGNMQEALLEYSQAVTKAQQNRNEAHGVDGDLMAEYAYALALHNDFEAALVYIDRARALEAKDGDFFAKQILTMMGYTEAAKQLTTQEDAPKWIDCCYQSLTQSHTAAISINSETPQDALKRANQLAASKQTIQSIALFEELKQLYPNAYILYIDYSTVWESLGKNDYAADLLEKGINMMPANERQTTFNNHLSEIKNTKVEVKDKSRFKKMFGNEPPRLMTYAGATAMAKTFLVNGRVGVYTKNNYSATVDIGLGVAGGIFTGNVGVSASKSWGVFFAGLGISDYFSKESNTFGLSPLAGLTFLNRSQTSSLDITFSGFIPLFSEAKFSYSVSIGKTFYLDLKGGKK
jgi:tetratricopeptide (TPR) repeat protein